MSLVVKTVSDSQSARQDLDKLNKSVQNIESSVQSVTERFSKFATLIGGSIAAATTLASLLKMSDSFVNLENKIKSVTEETEAFNKAMAGVQDIAVKTRSDLGATAALYQKISLNSKEIGINVSDTLTVVSTFNKALKISGANASEASGAILQFGQAIGSGRLQGDELRSIAENAPYIYKKIAEGFGLSVGEMKKAGEEGRLESGKVLKVIRDSTHEIDTLFEKLGITHGDAFKNMGTSFQILGNKVKTYFLGSGSGMAKWLNDMALGVYNFSKKFGLYMNTARHYLLMFAVDGALMFTEMWDAAKSTFAKIAASAKDMYDAFSPQLKEISTILLGWASIGVTAVRNFYNQMMEVIRSNPIVAEVLKTIEELKTKVSVFFSKLFSGLGIQMPEIDVSKFFKNLTPMLDLIKGWAKTVEGWFYWLYDRVIGHSWIPDLVNGIVSWIGKLLGTPLGFIKTFVKTSSSLLASLARFGVFAPAIKLAMRYKLALVGVLGVLTAIVATGAGLFGGEKSITFKTEGTKEKAKDYLKDALPKLKESITTFGKSVKENYKSNPVTHFVKQLFGMKDTTPGKLWGREINTKTYVGVGPKRDREKRPFLHDVFNAVIPPQFQAGLALAVTAAFTLGTRSFFLNSTFGTGLAFLVGGIIAGAFARIIDTKIIEEALFGTVRVVLTSLSTGLTKILGGNAIFNVKGLISVLMAITAMFAAGRQALGRVAAQVLSAGTNLSRAGADIREQRRVQANYNDTRARLATFHQDRADREYNARQVYARAHNDLANSRTATGNLLGGLDASRAIRNGVNYGGTPQTQALLEAAQRARAERTAAIQANSLPVRTRDYAANVATRDDLGRMNNQLLQRIEERRNNRENAIRGGFSGLGGVVGGVAGFQVGSEIAKAMTNSPEWLRVGTVLATAFLGQFLVAGIGNLLATAFIAATAPLVTLVTVTLPAALAPMITAISAFLVANPVTLIVLGIVAALVAAYALWKLLPDEWLKRIADASGYTTAKKTASAVGDMLNGEFDWAAAYKKLGEESADLFKEGFIPAWKKVTLSVVDFLTNAIPFSWIPKAIVGKATGGRISGPGTGTSDSIPAMLSNGEFVVNAKAAQKNATLLSAINSGSVAYFAEGGGVGTFTGRGALDPNLGKSIDAMIANGIDVNLITVKGSAAESFRASEIAIRNATDKNIEANKSWLDKLADEIKKIPGGESVVNAIKTYLPLSAAPQGSSTSTDDKGRNLIVGPDGKPTINLGNSKGSAEKSIKAATDAAANAAKGIGTPVKTWIESIGNKSKAEVDRDVMGYLTSKAGGDFQKLTRADMEKINSKTQDDIVKVIGMIKESEAKAAKLPKDSYLQNAVMRDVARLKGDLNSLVVGAVSGFDEDPSKFTEKQKEAKKMKDREGLKFQDELRIINESFPDLALTFDEFRQMADSTREALFDDADLVHRKLKSMLEANMGDGDNNTQFAFSKPLQDTEAERKALQEKNRALVESNRTPFQNLSPLFAEVKLQLTEEIIAGLDENGLIDIKRIATTLKNNQNLQKRTDLTPENRLAIIQDKEKQVEAYQKIVNGALRKGATGYKAFALDFAGIGMSIEQGVYNKLRETDRTLVDNIRAGIAKAQDVANNNPGSDTGVAAQEAADKARERLQEILTKRSAEKAKLAGESFSSEVYDGFTSALTAAMHGKAAEGKSVIQTFFKNILDSITSTIIGTFSKGITERLSNYGGDFLGKLGTGLFNTASGGTDTNTMKKDLIGLYESMPMWVRIAGDTYRNEMDKMSDAASPAVGQNGPGATPFSTGQGDVMASAEKGVADVWQVIGSSISKGLGALGQMVSNFNPFSVLRSIIGIGSMIGGLSSGLSSSASSIYSLSSGSSGLGLKFKATGGFIKGPGTGTSDSIPSMLSNGEFVINAKATKEFAPLLHAINSGSFKRFAAGGLVSTAMVSTPIMGNAAPEPKASSFGSNQVINLTITGDISRQTKREIYGMLPTIAAGVNSHNREKGYK